MTLTYVLDLDDFELYTHTKCVQMTMKAMKANVTVQARHTDATERITRPHSRVVITPLNSTHDSYSF